MQGKAHRTHRAPEALDGKALDGKRAANRAATDLEAGMRPRSPRSPTPTGSGGDFHGLHALLASAHDREVRELTAHVAELTAELRELRGQAPKKPSLTPKPEGSAAAPAPGPEAGDDSGGSTPMKANSGGRLLAMESPSSDGRSEGRVPKLAEGHRGRVSLSLPLRSSGTCEIQMAFGRKVSPGIASEGFEPSPASNCSSRSRKCSELSGAKKKEETPPEESSEICLRPLWDVQHGYGEWPSMAQLRRGSAGASGTRRVSRLKKQKSTFGDLKNMNQWTFDPIMRPGGPKRCCWDVVACALIVYDLITVPLQVFDPLDWVTMERLTVAFWALDIVASFLVGYSSGGITEMRFRKIAYRYLTSWFSFDLLLVSLDFLRLVTNVSINSSYARVMRFLRLFKILRVLKTQSFLTTLAERISSEPLLILMGIGRLVVIIVMLNHFIACAFYGLHDVVPTDTPTWVDAQHIHERNMLYRYATSMHWSLTQFTPASMEVVPTNAVERTMNVLVLIFALVIFSSFVSSITQAMSRLAHLDRVRTTEHTALRRYMRENRISQSVSHRVWGCINNRSAAATQALVHRRDVAALRTLPKTLQADIDREVLLPALMASPCFAGYLTDVAPDGSGPLVLHWCEHIIEVSLPVGQELFAKGEKANKAFYVRSGTCVYENVGNKDVVTDIACGAWMSEAALWLNWVHCGQLRATSQCEFFSLASADFQAIIRGNLLNVALILRYAYLFGQWAKGLDEAQREAILDTQPDADMLRGMIDKAIVNEDVVNALMHGHVQQEAGDERESFSSSNSGDLVEGDEDAEQGEGKELNAAEAEDDRFRMINILPNHLS